MTKDAKKADQENGTAANGSQSQRASMEKPDWADGLKRFYDSVVDEPLPDELTQLLSRLDSGEGA